METKDASTGAAADALPSEPGNFASRPGGDADEGVQIRCCLEGELGMFRVLEAKGKALSSGGFGVSMPQRKSQPATDADQTGGVGEEDNSKATASRGANEHLFIEEVLFLHERGLLECLAFPPTNNTDAATDPSCCWDTAQLFRLLPQLNMSVPMYLVYQHLRSQDFRVLRHDPKRLALLQRQQELRSTREKDMSLRQEATALRHQVRSSIAQALPPSIDDDDDDDDSEEGRLLTIAWDAYQPNSQFGKTHPGLPDFYVAVTYYNESHVRFAQIEELVVNHCHGIPLKLATVSDSGTVVMFGVSNMGVPSIRNNHVD